MTLSRQDLLLLVFLLGGIGILWGSAGLEAAPYSAMMDFKAVYDASRTLSHHQDPYNPAEFRSMYLSEGGTLPVDPKKLDRMNQALFLCVNLPTSFLIVVPLAALPWGLAHLLWLVLIAGFFLVAAYVMLKFAGHYAQGPPLFLIGMLLIDLGSLILLGNLAGIVVSFCVLAVWFFLTDRHTWAGVVCLAVALALKPHDAGFLWLYFILIGGRYRKHALQGSY